MTLCKDGTMGHYWLLGGRVPGQANDQATCKLCGTTKYMPNPFIDVPYQELVKRTHGRGKEERAQVVWGGQ